MAQHIKMIRVVSASAHGIKSNSNITVYSYYCLFLTNLNNCVFGKKKTEKGIMLFRGDVISSVILLSVTCT